MPRIRQPVNGGIPFFTVGVLAINHIMPNPTRIFVHPPFTPVDHVKPDQPKQSPQGRVAYDSQSLWKAPAPIDLTLLGDPDL
jgi:hypothetical protein